MSEAIMPSSNSRLTRVSACKPPKRFETPRSSSNAILLSWLPARRQDALGTKDHHQYQDQAEHHALILRRLKLRRQLTQRITAEQRKRQHGAGLTQSVQPERQALEQLQVKNRDAGCAEDRARDRTHAAQYDHGEDADGFHEGETLRVDKYLFGPEENTDRGSKRRADGKAQEFHPHNRHAHRSGGDFTFTNRLPRPPDTGIF